jgi:hypothetical protein
MPRAVDSTAWLRRLVIATVAALLPYGAALAQNVTGSSSVFPGGQAITATGSNALNISGTETVVLTASDSTTYPQISIQAGGILDTTALSGSTVVIQQLLYGPGALSGTFEVSGTDIPAGLQTFSGGVTYDGGSQLNIGLLESTSTATQLEVAQLSGGNIIVTPGAQLNVSIYSPSSFWNPLWFQSRQWPVVNSIQITGTDLVTTGTFAPSFSLYDPSGQLSASNGQLVLLQSGTAISVSWTPSSFMDWLSSNYGANAGVSGTGQSLDTPDGDGITNLVKYALALPTGTNDTALLPTVGISGTEFSYTYSLKYTAADAATDITYTLQTSPSPTGGWSSPVAVTDGTVPTTGTTQTITASLPINAFAYFLRLTVTDLANEQASTPAVGINVLGKKASVSGSIGPLDTPDGDGIPNLLKYSLGIASGTNDSTGAGLPTAGLSGSGFVLTYTHPDSLSTDPAHGPAFTPEWSTDNSSWNTSIVSSTDSQTGPDTITQAVISGSAFDLFLRLQVEDPANDVAFTPAIHINLFGQQALASSTTSANLSATATPDGDGIANLLKYALALQTGTNDGDISGLTIPEVSGTEFSLTFTQPVPPVDANYFVQWSTDQQTWTDVSGTGQPVGITTGTSQPVQYSQYSTAFVVYLRLMVTDGTGDQVETQPVAINLLGEHTTASLSGSLAATATPDGDGIPNLVKYALGLPAPQNDLGSAKLPIGTVSGTQFSLNYTVVNSATGVATCTPQWSTDLTNWQTTNLSTQSTGTTSSTQTFKASVSGSTFAMFFRLQVTDPANEAAYSLPVGVNLAGGRQTISGVTSLTGSTSVPGSASLTGSANLSATGVPDGDGIPNLLKYALALPAGTDDVASLPGATYSGTQFALTYALSTSATISASTVVQSSTDLMTWAAVTGTGQTVTNSGTSTTMISGTAPEGFMRLKVTDLLGDTVTGQPVGYVKFTVPATSATGPELHQWIATPFLQPAVHQGFIASVSGSTLTVTNANWTQDFTGTPHVALFLTGSAIGLSLPITSNTTNQLTLDVSGISAAYQKSGNFAPPWSASDTVAILPADTLGSLFGSAGLDSSLVLVTSGSMTSAASSASQPVYPANPAFVAYSGTAPLTVSFVGSVPTTQTVTVLPAAGIKAIANPQFTSWNPTNLAQISGWQSGNDPQLIDTVRFWNAEQWAVYYRSSNGLWRQAGHLQGAQFGVPVPSIPAGGGAVINRGKGAAPAFIVWPSSYQP